MESIQPKREYVVLFREIVLDVWNKKSNLITDRKASLERQVKELEGRKDRLVEAFLYKKLIDQATYEDQLAKLNESLTLTKMDLHDVELESFDVEGALAFAERALFDVGRLWQEFSFEQKQRFQKVLFPNGLQFADGIIGTDKMSLIFEVLRDISVEKTSLASPTGIAHVSIILSM